MLTGKPFVAILLLPALPLLTGCAQDREQAVMGKWETSQFSGMVTAFRAKDEAPSLSPSQAMGAGKFLVTAGVELRKDKTFSLVALANRVEGTWTFNKATGEVLMNVTRTQPLLGAAMPFKNWVAYVDRSNRGLSLYPGGPAEADMARKSGGMMANGIQLNKEE